MRLRYSKAFTLIEILISISILSVIFLALYGSFQAGIMGFRRLGTDTDRTLLAAQVFDRLEDDLAGAFAYSKNDSRFEGSADRTAFMAITGSYERDERGVIDLQKNYSRVVYFRQEAKLLRLCLKKGQSLRSEEGVTPDEMASSVQYVVFNYGRLDKGSGEIIFSDTWTDKASLPCCVRVVLAMAGGSGVSAKGFERTFYLGKSD